MCRNDVDRGVEDSLCLSPNASTLIVTLYDHAQCLIQAGQVYKQINPFKTQQRFVTNRGWFLVWTHINASSNDTNTHNTSCRSNLQSFNPNKAYASQFLLLLVLLTRQGHQIDKVSSKIKLI